MSQAKKKPKGKGVYILHFLSPFHHARHYVGSTADLQKRIHEHQTGAPNSSPLIAAAREQGIDFELSAFYPNLGTDEERYLKMQKNTSKYCPICASNKGGKGVKPRQLKKLSATQKIKVAFWRMRQLKKNDPEKFKKIMKQREKAMCEWQPYK